MAFLMFAIFIVLTFIAYFCGKRDLLSPWFLLCLVFLGTFCIVLLNYNKWDVNINGKFILYIVTAILSFGIGGGVVKLFTNNKTSVDTNLSLSIKETKITKKYPVNFFLIISIILASLYIGKLILDAGAASSLSGIVRNIYENIVKENYSPGTIFNQMLEIVFAIAYMNMFRLLLRLFSKNDSISIVKLVIPIVVFLITILISSDRNILLRFAIFSVCLWILFFRENDKGKNVNLKIISKALIIFCFVIIIFFLYGKMKRYTSNFLDSLSIYGGSGLYDFNLWIIDFNEPLMFGQSTFSTFLNSLETLLSPFGITFGNSVPRFDPFIEFVSSNGYFYSSNIYTALKPYIEDFGYFGVILFPFIIGAFYQWLFSKTKKKNYGFSWIIYCTLIYPIIFFPILEQLFRRFSFGFIYELGWITILYFFIYKKSKTKEGSLQCNSIEEITDEK